MLKTLSDWCDQLGANRTYWVAYSGGLDSAVLLHAAATLASTSPYSFKVIHVHHGLNPRADDWVKHGQQEAELANLPFVCQKVSLPSAAGVSLEASARVARYQAFSEVVEADDVIFTAHHADDQAETVLMQLMRGSGPKGLAAMPSIRALGEAWLVRPLLAKTRDDLFVYAKAHGLRWIDDDSNANTRFSRNFIRHEVLPVLKSRWPSMARTLARTAAHCAETESLLASLMADKQAEVQGCQPNTLSVSALRALSLPLQKALLRQWVLDSGHALPPTTKLMSIITDVLPAGEDKQACVMFGSVSVRRHGNDLYLVTAVAPADLSPREWQLTDNLSLAGVGVLGSFVLPGQGFSSSIASLTVRFRQGGEKISLRGRGRQRLKHLFQEWGVLPWERGRVPLLYAGEVLVGVVGYAMHADYEAKPDELGRVVFLETHPGT